MKSAIITRYKVYKTFMTPGYAWKWFYNVKVENCDVELSGFDYLDTARKMAKKYGADKIIESWKEKHNA